MLAGLGGVAGLVLARGGLHLLLSLAAGAVPRAEQIAVDVPVLVFTGGLVIVATLAFGLVPAWHAASTDIAQAFKEGGRGLSAPRDRVRAHNTLIVGEVALAVLLVIGAGLLQRSFERLLSEDQGYRVDDVLAVRLSLPNEDYTPIEAIQFFEQVTERTRAIPGVLAVSVVSRPPLMEDRSDGRFHIEDRTVNDGEEGFTGGGVAAGVDLLSILEIPLVRGRMINEDDRVDTDTVVVIDEEMARRYWPGQDPIGERIRFARTDGPMHRIVGVVGSAKFDRPTLRSPTYYFSYSQLLGWAEFFVHEMWVMVRTQGGSGAVLDQVRAVIRSLDPALPVANVATMREIVDRSVADRKFLMSLLSAFAGVALVLGLVGTFGVVAHAVTRRAQEIGVRLAIGARGEEVVRMVVRQGMATVLWGVAAGGVAALGARGVIAGFLYGVAATDPWTFTVVPAVVVGIALLAVWLPARRASRIDPMETLRVE